MLQLMIREGRDEAKKPLDLTSAGKAISNSTSVANHRHEPRGPENGKLSSDHPNVGIHQFCDL